MQLIHGLFATPSQQLEMARTLNDRCGLGFTKEDFIKLGQAPVWPDHHFLTVVILEVLLDDVQQTFDTAWDLASSQQPNGSRWINLRSDVDHLRLLAGQHERGLRWRVVELGAYEGFRPMDVRTPETAPAASILWMAYYSPSWVQSMNGGRVPFVHIPGYEVWNTLTKAWDRLVCLSFDGQMQISVASCHIKDRRWATPAYLE